MLFGKMLVLTSILAVSSIAVFFYIAHNSEINKTPDSQSTSSQTAPSPTSVDAWRTYTNHQFGYSFRYPSNGVIHEGSIASVDGRARTPNTVELEMPIKCDYDTSFFRVAVSPSSPELVPSLRDAVAKNKTSTVMIGGTPGTLFRDMPGLLVGDKIVMVSNGYDYVISDLTCRSETAQAILQTFRTFSPSSSPH